MIYRKLAAGTGDYVFGQNMNGFYSDADAVGQAIYTSLKLLQGEWWEDQADGLPLFQHILGQPGSQKDLGAADTLIKERIKSVPNVQQILSFSSSFANRTYKVNNAEVQTSFGVVPIKEVTFP